MVSARKHSVRPAVRVFRLARLGIHLAQGVLTVGTFFPYSGKARRQKMIRRWSGKLLRILNVSLSVSGTPPEGESLLVANHISWLDIYLINTVCPPRFVAKSEIRKWPVVGWLSEKTGALFVEREKRSDAGRVNQAISDAINAGDLVAVFPEGTTSDGQRVLSFRAPLLEPALTSNSNLHPVAIRYVSANGTVNTEVAYAGDTSFGQSLWMILGQRAVHAEIIFAGEIEPGGKNRKELAKHAECVIAAALNLPMPGMKPGILDDLQDMPQIETRPIGTPYPAPSDFH